MLIYNSVALKNDLSVTFPYFFLNGSVSSQQLDNQKHLEAFLFSIRSLTYVIHRIIGLSNWKYLGGYFSEFLYPGH